MSGDICKCRNWARQSSGILTEHHPRCDHYNDSLINVWNVQGCIFDDEELARETYNELKNDDPEVQIIEEYMHREVFNKLPEFQGF